MLAGACCHADQDGLTPAAFLFLRCHLCALLQASQAHQRMVDKLNSGNIVLTV